MNRLLVSLTGRIVAGGLALVIIITPVCFGTVHPRAYHAAETMVFMMLAALLLRIRAERPAIMGLTDLRRIAVPAYVLLLLIGFQLVPLPPLLLHILSPRTYAFYEHTLRGWPKGVDYPPPSAQAQRSSPPETLPVVLPTQREAENGAQIPFTASPSTQRTSAPAVGQPSTGPGWYGTTRRSLSLAPSLGIASGLKLLAAFALFAIVAMYPLTPEANRSDEDPLTRMLVSVILLAGFAVAALGLIQHVTWNGKLLWFFVPFDWGAPNLNRPRMMGPFVNPDHFAAYLAMVAPLFISRAWGELAAGNDAREQDPKVPILCIAALVIVVCGILLSRSRAVWGATIVACMIFAILVRQLRTPSGVQQRPGVMRSWTARLGLTALIVSMLALAVIGSAGRGEIDSRVGLSIAGEFDLWHRVDIWRDTLRMCREYPLFGVGFGAWPEVFPHYQSGPWPAEFFRNAHNDYVEAAAELGIIGAGALAMIGWRIVRLIWRRWSYISPRAQLTAAALLAGIALEGFHELFDFSLTIPAIGFLFAIFAGLIVRIAAARETDAEYTAGAGWLGWRPASYASAVALMAAAAAQCQASIVYPYYALSRSFDEARTMVLLHPANAGVHLALASWYGESPIAVSEVARAVWVDRRNPFAHDVYARYLLENGQYVESFDQIALSVMWAPSFGSHLYLNPRLIPYLSPAESEAVERGLAEASERGYAGAFFTLGAFYTRTGRVLDAARAYRHGASAERDTIRRSQLLMLAGRAYVYAGLLDQARRSFDQARALRPDDPEPYAALLKEVLLAQRNVSDAQSVLKKGLAANIDPAPLLAAFAQVAQASGEPDKAREALVKMVEYQPTCDNLLQLGLFYAGAHDYARGSEAFRRATNVDPENPRAWFELASSEDAAYQYVAADRDYSHASRLDPGNSEIRARYAAFKQKLAAAQAGSNADNNVVDSALSN